MKYIILFLALLSIAHAQNDVVQIYTDADLTCEPSAGGYAALTGWTVDTLNAEWTADSTAGTLTVGSTGMYIALLSLDLEPSADAEIHAAVFVGDTRQVTLTRHIDATTTTISTMAITGLLRAGYGETVSVRLYNDNPVTITVHTLNLTLLYTPYL